MKHLGDITKINGASVSPVNVIIGGSPCQDLSIAGKRAGLQGERSSLFLEQIRIIKEMRAEDAKRGRTGKDIRPRFMVWENVPGAFSSNKGADFGAVLRETIKVVCEEAPTIPIPKNGWPTAGCLTDMGGQWSVAWRVFDAQFWGVPQRRRRIALVADFGGLSAPEILFERESVSGYYPQGFTPWEAVTRNSAKGFGATGTKVAEKAFCLQGNGIDRSDNAGCNGRGWNEEVGYTLNTTDRHATVYSIDRESFSSGVNFPRDPGITDSGVIPPLLGLEYLPFVKSQPTTGSVVSVENHPSDSRVKINNDGIVQTLSAAIGTGGNTHCSCATFVKSSRAKSKDGATIWKQGGIANTLNTFDVGETRCNELVVNKSDE